MQSDERSSKSPRSAPPGSESTPSADPGLTDIHSTEVRSPEIPSPEMRPTPQSDWLPSRPPPLELSKLQDLTQLAPGQRLGDFLIRRVIGRGGFAAVYLALQWSLDREVALKITRPQAGQYDQDDGARCRGEGQHLAQLDHPNIVRVYQQTIEPHTGAQLLCMQYVSGATLELLIGQLRDRAGQWCGAELLEVIDRLPLPAVPLETAAWQERQALERADHIETICRIATQLASALDHAHRRGIFHRDIKPANVLVNRYGQPLLADFNLATRSGGKSVLIGGTLVYMSPEHLEAFAWQAEHVTTAVEQLGDIYSLGVLLWQTSTGELPFRDAADLKPEIDWSKRLRRMAQRRRLTPADELAGSEVFWSRAAQSDRRDRTPAPRVVDRQPWAEASFTLLGDILRKCLHAEPSRRYQSARSLRSAVEGLAQLHTARNALPAPGSLIAAAERLPIIALVLAGLLPQVIASALQITYNVSQVLDHFTAAQTAAFVQLVWWANPIIYGGCLLIFCHYLWQILPTWNRLLACDPKLTVDETAQARNHALGLPRRAATIAGVGWLIGAIVFPGGVILLGGPLPWTVLLHFWISFLLAGLISVTYSAFAIVAVMLRVFYLRFWLSPAHFRRRATAELRPLDQRLETITFLAGTIPLAAAATLIFAGSQGADDQGALGFRVLTVLLILAGGLGFSTVGRVVASLRALIRTWLQVPLNP